MHSDDWRKDYVIDFEFTIFWHFLFVWSLWPHLRIVHSYGYVTIAVEGMQNLTYARNSWPLRWTGSVTSHTFCETGSPFIMVISEDRDTNTYSRAFDSGVITTCFYDLGMSQLEFDLPSWMVKFKNMFNGKV